MSGASQSSGEGNSTLSIGEISEMAEKLACEVAKARNERREAKRKFKFVKRVTKKL